MAEAFAVVGIVASIVQLVDFGTRVLGRLEEYQSKTADIPESLSHIKAELPALLDALRNTQSAVDAGHMPDESKKALLPVIEGCKVQIKLLEELIAKTLPASGDSWTKRGSKALRSLRYDAKVEKITSVIRGYVQTLTYHAAASSKPISGQTIPPSPLPSVVPSSTVPFRRDPNFVDRHILVKIESRSQHPASRLALVGLGGVGKSQLAVEHSYRVQEKDPKTWVFWIHAGSTAKFVEGYRKIAERAKIPNSDQTGVDILSLVYNWLCDEANGKWLMIIDNADDAEVFASTSVRGRGDQDALGSETAPSLLNSIPQSSNGSILVTSRNRDVAFKLTGDYADILRVDPMGQRDALSLLQNQLKGGVGQDATSQTEASELVAELDYMPLAISQAAAYISQRAPRATVSTYLRDIQKGSQNRAKLLQTDLGDTRRDGTASNSILSTWQISFEHIRRERPSTTRLLSLMSLFNRQGIPEALLDGSYSESSDESDDFEDDLNMLVSYSLVATNVDGHFQMHRLVQYSTIKWLELHSELDRWKEKYVILMDSNYPMEAKEDLSVHETLFPHAQAAVAYQLNTQQAITSWISLLYKASSYAGTAGLCQVAIEMCQCALEISERIFGIEHESTLSIVSLLGCAFHYFGNNKGTELMCRRIIQAYEKFSWPKDVFLVEQYGNLALALTFQGSYEEAEAIYRRVLPEKEKLLGLEAQSTAITVMNLGILLGHMSRFQEAEIMFERALIVHKKLHGPQHADTLWAMGQLGSIYREQGKLTEAETILRQTLEANTSRVGKEHPDMLDREQELSSILSTMGNHNEAEFISRQALETSIAVLGEGHPTTISGVTILGRILQNQEKYEEAEALHRNALRKAKEIFGDAHPTTLSNMHHLACDLWALKRGEEAILLAKESYVLHKATFGSSHVKTRVSLDMLREWGEDVE